VQRFALCLVGLSVVAGTAQAVDRAEGCVGINDDQARLACYDAAYGRVPAQAVPERAVAPAAAPASVAAAAPAASSVAAPAAASPVGAPAAAGAVSAEQARQEFGLPESQKAGAETKPTEITAKVVSVGRHSVPGRWTVTLDNGQVWEQRETTPAARRPSPGDTVTIRKAVLGSYLLNSPATGSSRVRRVR